MQGSSSRGEKLRRLLVVLVLQCGFLVGAGLFALLLLCLGRIVTFAPYGWVIAVAITAFLFSDVYSVLTRRLNVCSIRRQARKSMLYAGHRQNTVGFVWGFDAGFGIGTYRVTSGLWVLALLALFTNVSSWTIIVYAIAFNIALLSFVVWPVMRRGADEVDQVLQRRLLTLSRRRNIAQIAYIIVGVFAVRVISDLNV